MAGGAVLVSAAVIALELRHVVRRAPAEPRPVAQARTAAGHTAAVIREGYRERSNGENAVLNMLIAFLTTFAGARLTTYLIRSGRGFGPLRNLVVRGRHVHHFVHGIVLALVFGAAAIGIREERLDKMFAVPFGAGAALILDESALLLELEDVYWSEEGVVSVQIAFAGAAVLALAALVRHLLQAGEPVVERQERAAAHSTSARS